MPTPKTSTPFNFSPSNSRPHFLPIFLQAEITADQIQTLLNATNNKVEGFYPIIFASYLKPETVTKLINTPGGAGGGGGGGAAAGGEAAEAVKEEEVVEEEEVDMGGSMDMFGGEATGGGDY